MLTFLQFISEQWSMKWASKRLTDKTYAGFDHSDEHEEKVDVKHIRATDKLSFDEPTVKKYQERLKKGEILKSPRLVPHKNHYGILDGHHRIEAHIRNGATHIMAKVDRGH